MVYGDRQIKAVDLQLVVDRVTFSQTNVMNMLNVLIHLVHIHVNVFLDILVMVSKNVSEKCQIIPNVLTQIVKC